MAPLAIRVAVTTILLSLLRAAPARAEAYFYALGVEIERSGQPTWMLFPRAFQERPGLEPNALAQAALARLRADRPDVHGDSAVTVKGDVVELFLGTGAMRFLPASLGELYYSMLLCGFADIRAPQIQPTPLTAESVGLAAFLPVVPWWRALPPNEYRAALIVTTGGALLPAPDFNRRLQARQEAFLQPVLDLLRTGSEEQKLAAIQALSALRVDGLPGQLMRLLAVAEPSAVKRAVLDLLAADRSKRFLDALVELAERDADPVVKSTAARILIAAGNQRFQTYVLLEKLRSAVDAEVLEALRQLSAAGDPSVAASFAPLLAHHSPQVRDAALAGLQGYAAHDALGEALQRSDVPAALRLTIAGQLAGLDAKPALRDAALLYVLGNGGPDAATKAVERLGALKVDAAIPALVAALAASDAGVRHASARALAALRAGRNDVLEALAAASARADDTPVMEAAAVEILAAMGLDAVIRLADHPDARMRQYVLRALAEFSKGSDRVQPRILAVLQGRLQDPNPELRRAAVYALARTQDEQVVRDLFALKGDPDDLIREQVAISLQRSKHPEAAATLLEFLKDPSDRVKLQAVVGVRLLGVHDALETLRWMVDYGNKEVKRAVFAALVALAVPADHGNLFDIYARALFDLDPEIKVQAIEGMRVIRDPRVVGQIGMLARDPDETVQLRAVAALGASGDRGAVDPLAMALTTGSPAVKKAALDAFKALALEEGVRPIQEFIKTETDPALRAAAEDALRAMP